MDLRGRVFLWRSRPDGWYAVSADGIVWRIRWRSKLSRVCEVSELREGALEMAVVSGDAVEVSERSYGRFAGLGLRRHGRLGLKVGAHVAAVPFRPDGVV